ncbi:MAG: TraI domain-containing protein [Burkholderiales bacterium]|nr:TraI domain-containing protein [Burkholderiales bacterium]
MANWRLPWKKRNDVGAPERSAFVNKTGYTDPQRAEKLLHTDRRQSLLDLIWEQTSMSKPMFQKLYLAPIYRYAEFVQEFPASENHHHAYPGGMLDHGLELMYHGLKLRQGYLLPPGAAPEDQSKQTEAWSAGIAYGGLLHDVGKVVVDIVVETSDGKLWHPWQGAIAKPYRFRYIKGRDYKLHSATAGMFGQHILGPEVMTWLSGFPELWQGLLYLLAGNYEQAGVVGEIVGKADRFSTSLNIGANPDRILQAPVTSPQKQWLLGLQTLVKTAQSQSQINVRGQPFWLTQSDLWLVSMVTANSLRAHLLKQGLDGVPQNNNRLFDELQSHGILQATPGQRAIWKIRIEDGDWTADLTCVKIKPSLIWGSEQYPSPFAGKVTVLGDGETAEGDGETEGSIPKTKQTKAETNTTTRDGKETPASPDDADDGVSELLKLFSDDAPATPVSTVSSGVLSPSMTGSKKEVGEAGAEPAPSRPPSKQKAEKTEKQFPKKLDELEMQGRKALADDFISWLTGGLREQRFPVNDTNAKIHIVDSQLFLVTPGIFQRFCLEQSGQDDGWKKVQQGFEKLKLHKKRPDDLNIWACTVKGPRKSGKKIQGYLLDAEKVSLSGSPNDNPFLTLIE